MMLVMDPAWHDYDLEIYEYGWHAADELETIELGDRVVDWFTNSMLANAYTCERDRVFSVTLMLFGQVAQRARETVGIDAIPEEWYPKADDHE